MWAPNARTVQALAGIAPPTKAGSAVAHHLLFLGARWPYSADYERLSALEAVFKLGGRWRETTTEDWNSADTLITKVPNIYPEAAC